MRHPKALSLEKPLPEPAAPGSAFVSSLVSNMEPCWGLNTVEKGLAALESALENTPSTLGWLQSGGLGAPDVSGNLNKLACSSCFGAATALANSPGALIPARVASVSSFPPNMFPGAAGAAGGDLNTAAKGDGVGAEVDGAVVVAVDVAPMKGVKGDVGGADVEGSELGGAGIGGIPKRPPDDVENPDCGEDTGEAPGTAIVRTL